MLRAMYDAMVESRLWTQSRNLVPAISEATAVSSALVLHRTDTLAAPPDGRTLYPVSHLGANILPLDPAGVQAACESATRKGRGAVIAICPEEEFDASLFHRFLALAHERRWPSVCIALTDRFSNPKAPIPEIDVDGHDAVAMFRVVSEALRRARNHRPEDGSCRHPRQDHRQMREPGSCRCREDRHDADRRGRHGDRQARRLRWSYRRSSR